MATYSSHLNYYFIPFGREPGSLLDVLDLPSSADEKTIKKAFSARRKEIKSGVKEEIVIIMGKRSDGILTEQEFLEHKEELKKKETDELAALNELNDKFKKELAEKRENKDNQIADYHITWIPLYEETLQIKNMTDLMLRMNQLPLPKMSVIDLKKITINTPSVKAEKLDVKKEIHLGDWMDYVFSCRLSILLLADHLWSHINWINHSYWELKMEEWSTQNGLAFSQVVPKRESIHQEKYCPNLSRSYDLSVKELLAEDLTDINYKPERISDQAKEKNAALLRQLLKEVLGLDLEIKI